MGCNLLTGAGFDVSFGGAYSMAWLGLVILTFIIIFARKWVAEEADFLLTGCLQVPEQGWLI